MHEVGTGELCQAAPGPLHWHTRLGVPAQPPAMGCTLVLFPWKGLQQDQDQDPVTPASLLRAGTGCGAKRSCWELGFCNDFC